MLANVRSYDWKCAFGRLKKKKKKKKSSVHCPCLWVDMPENNLNANFINTF